LVLFVPGESQQGEFLIFLYRDLHGAFIEIPNSEAWHGKNK